MFTLGNPNLTIGTDHKPLVSIMGPKNLEDIKNPKVRAMKDETLMCKFDVKHVPGKKHKGPDATSRYPGTRLTDREDLDMEEAFSITAVRRWQTEEFKAITWERVKEIAVTDKVCVRLNAMIRLGFSESRAEMDYDLKPFWPMREDLYMLEEVPMNDDQMYIPAELRGGVGLSALCPPGVEQHEGLCQGQVLLAKHGCCNLPEEKPVQKL